MREELTPLLPNLFTNLWDDLQHPATPTFPLAATDIHSQPILCTEEALVLAVFPGWFGFNGMPTTI
jgi:hypothetical protein